MTVLVLVLVDTPAVALIGLDKIGLPARPVSSEQADEETLAALVANQVTTLARASMSEAFEDMKEAVVTMIEALTRGIPASALTVLARRPGKPALASAFQSPQVRQGD